MGQTTSVLIWYPNPQLRSLGELGAEVCRALHAYLSAPTFLEELCFLH